MIQANTIAGGVFAITYLLGIMFLIGNVYGLSKTFLFISLGCMIYLIVSTLRDLNKENGS